VLKIIIVRMLWTGTEDSC